MPEVSNVQIYAGNAAPFNFNGLVRHYFLRRSPSGADLQVNLVSKHERDAQSHDLAKRVRPALVEIAQRRGARVKVIEIPPGPPVLDTLVAEVYGPTAEAREKLGRAGPRLLRLTTEGVVDVDDSLEAAREHVEIVLDREKAGLKGIPAATVVEAIAGPGQGRDVGRIDVPARAGAGERAGPAVGRGSGRPRAPALPAGRLAPGRCGLALRAGAGRADARAADHRPQGPEAGGLRVRRPGGSEESPVYALAALNQKIDALELPGGARVERYAVEAPRTSERAALKWDGEWQITYEVFRDLGIAFAVVLVLIAILVIGWFQCFTVPLAILLPIPLSLIGILPGHLGLGAFFTATSMIGFIAGAGIIVRNSIILVDFIELKLRQGMALEDAVVEAGVVRFRPMLLTAAAVVVGSFVILFDPIFQGLALSLMMGEVAATLLSRMAVPVVYYLIARRGRAELPSPGRARAALAD